jgi:hypothetical protein
MWKNTASASLALFSPTMVHVSTGHLWVTKLSLPIDQLKTLKS